MEFSLPRFACKMLRGHVGYRIGEFYLKLNFSDSKWQIPDYIEMLFDPMGYIFMPSAYNLITDFKRFFIIELLTKASSSRNV